MAVGDIVKNPLEMFSNAGILIDANGSVAPLRALIGIDEDTGLPVVVTVKDGKIQTNAALTIAGVATQTTLAAILAKLIAAPATESTIASILAKLSSDPATQTTLATMASDIALMKIDLAAIRAILES
jgi:hypothetical protein